MTDSADGGEDDKSKMLREKEIEVNLLVYNHGQKYMGIGRI